ncbi:smoothelin-like isoform X2 [Denticeps clupeoides]|nr:smoothelin-like isoform X2 [Denticeps clupeoides]XP_028822690.1 smoothelin-like isoform X2 [Denticeps clupeoides]
MIRAALRDLRHREIEDMEAALRSKRFRHAPHQRDKENQQRPESLDTLTVKLESIQDVDELTGLLRSTGDYEERKLIRAAIRRVRDQDVQGLRDSVVGGGSTKQTCELHTLNTHNPTATERESGKEREPIRAASGEPGSQSRAPSRELHGTGSGSSMVLVLDPLVREKVSGLQNMCPSEDSTSDPEVISTFQRQRCDSSQSDHQGAPSERPSCNSSTSSTDSQVDAGQGDHAHDECDWAALGFLPNGSRRGEKSSAEQKVCQGQETPAKQRLHKHTDLSSGGVLGRVFSVRDRMLKFSEPASCGAPPLRRGSQRSSRFTGPSPTATDTQSQEGPVVGVPLQAPPPSSSSSAVPPSPPPPNAHRRIRARGGCAGATR